MLSDAWQCHRLACPLRGLYAKSEQDLCIGLAMYCIVQYGVVKEAGVEGNVRLLSHSITRMVHLHTIN